MIALQPGFLKYHQDKTTVKDGPRMGASPMGRVRKTVVHAPIEPKAIHAMPIVAVIGAIASFAGGAAIATAAGATMGAMIVGGAMMVGAALTIVGVVTENEKLMKIGGILSLVGGVGALGLGAMGGLTNAATVGETAMSGLSATGASTIEAAEAGLSASGQTVAESLASGAGGVAGAAQPGILDTGGPGDALDAAKQTMPIDAAPPQAVTPYTARTDNAFAPGENPTPFKSDGILQTNPQEGGILDWVNKNKEVTKIGVDALGGIAKAIPTDKDKALIEQTKAGTALTREQIDQLARRKAYAQGKLYVKGG